MLETSVDFILSIVISLILMFSDSDSLVFLLHIQSNTTTSTNMAIAKTMNKAREEAERYMPIMATLESTITSFFLSGTTPVVTVWSLEVVC